MSAYSPSYQIWLTATTHNAAAQNHLKSEFIHHHSDVAASVMTTQRWPMWSQQPWRLIQNTSTPTDICMSCDTSPPLPLSATSDTAANSSCCAACAWPTSACVQLFLRTFTHSAPYYIESYRLYCHFNLLVCLDLELELLYWLEILPLPRSTWELNKLLA